MDLLLIFLGGAIGSALRYIFCTIFDKYPLEIIGILFVNILGCFFIGFISYLAIKRNNLISEKFKHFLVTGIAGSFTTFSAFSYATMNLFIKHHYFLGLLNIFLSVILGLIFVSWGMNCGFYTLNYFIQKKRTYLKEKKEIYE